MGGPLPPRLMEKEHAVWRIGRWDVEDGVFVWKMEEVLRGSSDMIEYEAERTAHAARGHRGRAALGARSSEHDLQWLIRYYPHHMMWQWMAGFGWAGMGGGLIALLILVVVVCGCSTKRRGATRVEGMVPPLPARLWTSDTRGVRYPRKSISG